MNSIDFHVHLLPPWAREKNPPFLTGETEHLRRHYAHPSIPALHAGLTPEALLREMDENRIERAIIFSYAWQSSELCKLSNAFIQEVVASTPDRLCGLAVLQPRDPDAAEELGRCLERPEFIGLKLKPQWQGFRLSDLEVVGAACEVLIEKGGFLLTHISQGYNEPRGDHVHDLVYLLRNFPELTVIAAHMGGFVNIYDLYEPVARHFKNLYVDISLPKSIRWLPHLLDVGNPEKFLFATDYPLASFEMMLEQIANLGLDEKTLELILYQNARRLIG